MHNYNEKEFRERIANFLRVYQEKNRLTQMQAAGRMEIPVVTFRNLEKQRQQPNLSVVFWISKKENLSLNEVILGEKSLFVQKFIETLDKFEDSALMQTFITEELNDFYPPILDSNDLFSPTIGIPFIGKQLRNLRKGQGLTQERLTRKLGVSLSLIQKMEQGLQIPSIETLLMYSKFFGLSLDNIVIGFDRGFPAEFRPFFSGTDPSELRKKMDLFNTRLEKISIFLTKLRGESLLMDKNENYQWD